ncbi:hypothetical protein M885DRAFT_621148 [Pelagophyceae sp. CCMP2097]|nr:hypothetical protein M885DRAFT_621148 [Pelagophyceae sp. CCMP2097]|mmetsp:Transcript_24558/g.87794  ORF Transcript_24558/g.87794 Transcript_24558/m.87794 type:complete len:190 (-) Transcript_24558:199-768(-)
MHEVRCGLARVSKRHVSKLRRETRQFGIAMVAVAELTRLRRHAAAGVVAAHTLAEAEALARAHARPADSRRAATAASVLWHCKERWPRDARQAARRLHDLQIAFPFVFCADSEDVARRIARVAAATATDLPPSEDVEESCVVIWRAMQSGRDSSLWKAPQQTVQLLKDALLRGGETGPRKCDAARCGDL